METFLGRDLLLAWSHRTPGSLNIVLIKKNKIKKIFGSKHLVAFIYTLYKHFNALVKPCNAPYNALYDYDKIAL